VTGSTNKTVKAQSRDIPAAWEDEKKEGHGIAVPFFDFSVEIT
jgi:hypothetical protein